MICRVFTGSGQTLEDASKEAEAEANAELKNLPNKEAIALSTTHTFHRQEHETYTAEWHLFTITVLYQKKERR
jgi:hypothetical protein